MNEEGALGLIAFMVLVGPAVLLTVLRSTWLYWLPGALLIVLGIVAFVAMPERDDDWGLTGIAIALQGAFGIGCWLYGIAYLWIGHRLHRRALQPAPHRPPPPVQVPPAIVVNERPKT